MTRQEEEWVNRHNGSGVVGSPFSHNVLRPGTCLRSDLDLAQMVARFHIHKKAWHIVTRQHRRPSMSACRMTSMQVLDLLIGPCAVGVASFSAYANAPASRNQSVGDKARTETPRTKQNISTIC